jgi:BNR repeat-like domain
MPSIEIVDTGVIYRNPNPALMSRHVHFPSLVALPDGDLVAAMDIGSAFEAVDVRSFVCRSSDEGKTWSQPAQIFEPDESRHPVSTTCRINSLPDGSLIGWVCLFDRTRTDMGLADPKTDGFVRTEFTVTRSGDGGKSWSQPSPVKLPVDWHHFETCSPPVTTGDRTLVPSSPLKSTRGEYPDIPSGVAFTSLDGGETWPEMTTVFPGGQTDPSAWEMKLTTLSDGRVLAVCWSYDPGPKKAIDNRWVVSTDGGASFDTPQSTGIHGETCTPIALEDNRVLCVYRRFDKPGLWSQLAQVGADSWTPLADQLVWGGPGYAAGRLDAGGMFENMSDLQMGLPTLIRLPGGDVLAAFWCVEHCVSNIRWYRIRIG